MYMLPDMIEMGLRPDQNWPTAAHKKVAQRLALCNPLIKTRDDLTEVVQKVIAIPRSQIKKVEFKDLPKYGLGLCVGPSV